MEMIRSNDNYNFNIHRESQSTSKVSICNLVKQLKPSSSNLLPRAKSRSKENQSLETRPIQRKKQVRRRAHTTKPYQERLLNMAEARKEIVSALKLHRASMKKQQQQQQQNVTMPTLIHQSPPEQQLPTFKAITIQDCYTKPSPDHPATLVEPTTLQIDQETTFALNISNGQCQGGAVEPRALDEEEMAEIRSIGEMHQMEWDDTLNFATYALWFKFLYEMDLSEQDHHSVCVLNQSCDRMS